VDPVLHPPVGRSWVAGATPQHPPPKVKRFDPFLTKLCSYSYQIFHVQDRIISTLQNEISNLQGGSARGSTGGMRRAGASSRGGSAAAVGRSDPYANPGYRSAGSQRGYSANSQGGSRQPGFVPPSADRYVLRSADGNLRVPSTPSQRRDAASTQESINAVRDL
jgi:hypothetical protein